LWQASVKAHNLEDGKKQAAAKKKSVQRGIQRSIVGKPELRKRSSAQALLSLVRHDSYDCVTESKKQQRKMEKMEKAEAKARSRTAGKVRVVRLVSITSRPPVGNNVRLVARHRLSSIVDV
jgi:hypothetical protein